MCILAFERSQLAAVVASTSLKDTTMYLLGNSLRNTNQAFFLFYSIANIPGRFLQDKFRSRVKSCRRGKNRAKDHSYFEEPPKHQTFLFDMKSLFSRWVGRQARLFLVILLCIVIGII